MPDLGAPGSSPTVSHDYLLASISIYLLVSKWEYHPELKYCKVECNIHKKWYAFLSKNHESLVFNHAE